MTDPTHRPWLRPELVASWREIGVVLLVVIAPWLLSSALAAGHGSASHYFETFLSDRRLLLNLAAESSILGLLLVYLKWRGWQPPDLRIRPSVGSTAQGIALLPLALAVNGLTVFGLLWIFFLNQREYLSFYGYLMAHSPKPSMMHVENLSWPVLLVSLTVNAFLEEISCTAYLFAQLAAKRGPLFALCLVVPLRMLCHTYQGVVHMIGVGTLFLIYGLWYWRTRNLWTLIFAHALLDISNVGALKLAAH